LPTLLPVTVQEHLAGQGKSVAGASRAPSGVIEIEIGAARVRVRRVVDEATVRSVLQALGHALIFLVGRVGIEPTTKGL
jgi:transposase